jgi:UDP-2,3-diacylglucosamine pyrophosphatase LpxH
MADDSIARFDAIHVISDIHMGGLAGAQILRETRRLAGFIDRIAAERPGQPVALVLNGDVVDTLAEDVSGFIAVDEAVRTLVRIIDDPAFAGIWRALSGFVRTSQRTLVFVIGNHDLELALPPVQRLIVSRLAQEDAAARGRIEFSTMGAGWTCTVGGTRVFTIHGNEVDPWNLNRYEDLAKAARRLNAGQRLEPSAWQPNAGTRMVKEVMNDIKRRYAWIDLLKPETSAAVGTLLVMDPAQMHKLAALGGVLDERIRARAEVNARLAADGVVGSPAGPGSIEALLGDNLLQARSQRLEIDMLRAAERSIEQPDGGLDGTAPQPGTLGTGQLLWDRLTGWITGVRRPEALRRALKDWLRGDGSFRYDDRDATCEAVLQTVGPAVDIVVTGHTHLARAIDLGGGRSYFNSGTWIRLMQFTEAMLADEASFAEVYRWLHDGTMATLDAARFDGRPLLLDRTTEVEVASDGAVVVARLNIVAGDGGGAMETPVQFIRAIR